MTDATVERLLANARIGVITALPTEFAALRLVFGDGRVWHARGRGAGRRFNLVTVPTSYVGVHTVALTMLPDVGNNTAASFATVLLGQIPTIEHIIMCGIAGGIPNASSPEHDVRLGDIVVSNRNGVIQYDHIKEHPDGTPEFRHPPRAPGAELLEAVKHLRVEEELGNHPWSLILQDLCVPDKWKRPSDDIDARGRRVDLSALPEHQPGTTRVFHAPIASSTTLLKNPKRRDLIARNFGVKAVEMEGSGIADAAWLAEQAGYLVVRGIVDYCDAEKGDVWHRAAALGAAAYVKSLISTMRPREPPEVDLALATSRTQTTGVTPSARADTYDRIEAWTAGLNEHFRGHARILSASGAAVEITDVGHYVPDSRVADVASTVRSQLDLNDAHALVTNQIDTTTRPIAIHYQTTDFATIQALRQTGQKPRVLSACAVIVSPSKRVLYMHQRSGTSATYGGRLHTFGGAFQPGGKRGDRSLEATILREIHEETDKWINKGVWPSIIMEETTTGFVQVVFLGVISNDVAYFRSYEGSTRRLTYDTLEDELLIAGSRWVPSGKMQIMAWLAAGTPGDPGASFDGASPEELLRRILERSERDYQ